MQEFVIFTGPMSSGKTSSLLAYIDRCQYQKRNVVVFKPQTDNRYSETCIVSHGGWSRSAVVVSNVAEIYAYISMLDSKPDVVAIDEIFMLDGASDAMIWLYREGISIAVSTLDLSYKGVPFKETEKILPWATRVEKCAAVCTNCGQDAYYTHKKVVNEREIEVGGLDMYEARCIKCHPFILNGQQ